MNTSLTEALEAFREAVTQFAWGQWCAIGVAGSGATPVGPSYLIDPEPLLGASLWLARWDPRVFDELIDWLVANGKWINTQRLSSLVSADALAEERLIQAVAAAVAERSRDSRWRQLAGEGGGQADPQMLFHDSVTVAAGPPDETFLRHGFHRTPLRTRGMSRAVPMEKPRCLRFRVRALFGVSVRSDVVAHLIASGEDYASNASRSLGFSQKQVQETMVGLAESGLVRVRKEGRCKLYSVSLPKWWPFLYGGQAVPRDLNWRALCRGIKAVLKGAEQAASAASPYLASSLARQSMKAAREDLLCCGLGIDLSEASAYPGEEYLPVFTHDLEGIAERLQQRDTPV